MQDDDGAGRVYGTARIAWYASYKHIFQHTPATTPPDEPFSVGEKALQMNLEEAHEDLPIAVSAAKVERAFASWPKGKTSGRELIIGETWSATMAALPTLPAFMAWSWNKRLRNDTLAAHHAHHAPTACAR